MALFGWKTERMSLCYNQESGSQTLAPLMQLAAALRVV
jgi:hypothetical protein